jgi:iron(III) transport system substrate-binding protein
MKFFVTLFLTLFITSSNAEGDLMILTDRSLLHIEPLVKLFEEKHNIKVFVTSVKEGTIRNRIQDQRVDVVYATEVTEIEEIEESLKPFYHKLMINPELVSKNNKWISPSFRIRGAYHSHDLKISDSWIDLSKNKICVRPLTHPYNISLFQALSKETANVDKLIKEINGSMVKPASGNDRKQASLMHSKQCDVAILNNYYVKIMQESKDYKEIVDGKTFTQLTINGKFVALQSAVGVVKDSEQSQKFIEFMMSKDAQDFFVNVIGEHSSFEDLNIVGASGLYNRKDMYLKLKELE